MKRIVLLIVLSTFAFAMCNGQNAGTQAASPDAAQAASSNQMRGAIPTTLVKSLDSKKLKEGDTMVCQTSAALHAPNGLLIPTGTKVIGHVTQAQARSKGNADSTLAVVFDKMQLSTGKELPLKGVLQAVGPSLGNEGPMTTASGGMSMGGHNGTAADTATVAPPSNDAVAGPNSGVHSLTGPSTRPILQAQSQGVLGIKNLEMGKDSVLTSTNKEVKLDSGTQMMIRAEIEIPVQ